MDLAALPGAVWQLITEGLPAPALSALLRTCTGVRLCTLANLSQPPQHSMMLVGQSTSALSQQLGKCAAECPAMHLYLHPGPGVSPREATELALAIVRSLPAELAPSIVMLTLKGMHLNSMFPTAFLAHLTRLQELVLMNCQFEGDPHYHHQCVLARVPQTWRVQFNNLHHPHKNPLVMTPRTQCVRSTCSSVRPTATHTLHTQHSAGLPSTSVTVPRSPPADATLPHPAIDGRTGVRLCSVSAADTSVRMLYDLPLLAAHITSLKLSNVLDFQDRLHYPMLIQTIGQHLVNIRTLDTGSMYWVMRQAETEALLSLPHLSHLTVSGFVLEASLADHPCRWRTLTCTCWDGWLHVPTLAYLPLHHLQEPLLLSAGVSDDPLRLEGDGGITLRLNTRDDGRSACEAEHLDVKLLAQAVRNVMDHCGVRYQNNVERVMLWNGGEQHCLTVPQALLTILPLITGAVTVGARLELAYVPLGTRLLDAMAHHMGSALRQLTLFCCPMGHAVPSMLATHFPALQQLLLTGHVYDEEPAEEDLSALLSAIRFHHSLTYAAQPEAPACAQPASSTPAPDVLGAEEVVVGDAVAVVRLTRSQVNIACSVPMVGPEPGAARAATPVNPRLTVAVAKVWSPTLKGVRDMLPPLPEDVALKAISTVSCLTPKGVFPYKPGFTDLD